MIALLRRRPAIAVSLLETMARRVRRFADIRPVHERLAHYIASAAGESRRLVAAGLTMDLALTQEQLAARLGTVRELVARAFSQLETRGVITRKHARIVIRDAALLAALARGDLVSAPQRARDGCDRHRAHRAGYSRDPHHLAMAKGETFEHSHSAFPRPRRIRHMWGRDASGGVWTLGGKCVIS